MTAILRTAPATEAPAASGPPCDCCGDRFAPKEKRRRGRLGLIVCVDPTPCINRAIVAGRWQGRLS